MSEEIVSNELLQKFKKRMKIFHSAEDDNLKDILAASKQDILSLVGSTAESDPRTTELIMERSRYVYNDSLEFFYDNFQQHIFDLSLGYAAYLDGDEDDSQSTV